MPTTTNLGIPYPAAGDNPNASVYVALAKKWDDLVAGPWISWAGTMVVTQSLAISKTVNRAVYRLWGKHLEFKFKTTMLASGPGGNQIFITGLPVNNKYTTNQKVSGMWTLNTGSVTNTGVIEHNSSATSMVLLPQGAAPGATGDTYTTALALSDVIWGWGRYEVA